MQFRRKWMKQKSERLCLREMRDEDLAGSMYKGNLSGQGALVLNNADENKSKMHHIILLLWYDKHVI